MNNMRKVILYIASSLDGYIAGKSGEIDWLFSDQDYGYTEFFANVDTVLMGRLTYEQALSFGEYPYKGREGFVFSRTRAGIKDDHVRFVSGSVKKLVDDLKNRGGKNIWVVGGGVLIQACLEEDVIDEMEIFVHPIILGEGIPLFRTPLQTKHLTFQNCKAFDSGLVQLTYVRHHPAVPKE